jgi:hypothetical protein
LRQRLSAFGYGLHDKAKMIESHVDGHRGRESLLQGILFRL